MRGISTLLLFLGACQDLPTSVPTSPHASTVRSTQLSSAGRHTGEVQFYCVEGRRSWTAVNSWETRVDTLYFPRAELDGAGRHVLYHYRQSSTAGKPLSAADCVVPYTEAALRRVDRFFRVRDGGGAEQFRARQEMITILTDCVETEAGCPLSPVTVVAPPPQPPTCEACGSTQLPGGGGGEGGADSGGWPSGGGDSGSGDGGDDDDPEEEQSAYQQGPLLWAVCILAIVGSTQSIWEVANKFEAWYKAYQDAEGAQRLWQATVQNNPDPVTQQLYEYQYKQARLRQDDAKGDVSSATGVSVVALVAAGLACGATALVPVP